jgi:hypothetical protein
MASIKEATESALTFAREALGPERTAGAQLEEVQSTRVHGKDAWLITLSMIKPEESPGLSSIADMLNRGEREYKSFTVLKGSGEVVSMKIRELADA